MRINLETTLAAYLCRVMSDLVSNDSTQSKDDCESSIEFSMKSAEQQKVPLPDDLHFEIEEVGEEGTVASESSTAPSLTDEKTPVRKGMRIPHKTYTVEYKLSVLDWYYANGENKRQTAKHFGIDRKRIRDWLGLEQQFREATNSIGGVQCTRTARGCPPRYQELDKTVLEWYKEQRVQGHKVTNRVLRTKALELASQVGFQDTFKASPNWAIAWRRRNSDALGEDDDRDDHTMSPSAIDLDEQCDLNSESDFAAVTETINGVRFTSFRQHICNAFLSGEKPCTCIYKSLCGIQT